MVLYFQKKEILKWEKHFKTMKDLIKKVFNFCYFLSFFLSFKVHPKWNVYRYVSSGKPKNL